MKSNRKIRKAVNKKEVVIALQIKIEKYFENKKLKYKDDDRRKEAARRAVWLIIQKDYSISAASYAVGRTCKVSGSGMEKFLQTILSAKMRTMIKKRGQRDFFMKLNTFEDLVFAS